MSTKKKRNTFLRWDGLLFPSLIVIAAVIVGVSKPSIEHVHLSRYTIPDIPVVPTPNLPPTPNEMASEVRRNIKNSESIRQFYMAPDSTLVVEYQSGDRCKDCWKDRDGVMRGIFDVAERAFVPHDYFMWVHIMASHEGKRYNVTISRIDMMLDSVFIDTLLLADGYSSHRYRRFKHFGGKTTKFAAPKTHKHHKSKAKVYHSGSSSTSSGSSHSTRTGSGCTTVRCGGTTQKGNQCKRRTTNCNGRCWQH